MLLDVGWGTVPRGDVNVDIVMRHNVTNFIKADAQKLPFIDRAFTESLSNHAIEHLADPENMVSELKRVTQKKIMINTPLFFSFGYREIFKKRKNREHIHYFLPNWFRYRGFKTFISMSLLRPLLGNKVLFLPLPFFSIHAFMEKV